MTGFLALDLSKRSTGWALWMRGWDVPRYGHWVLGSEFTSDGRVFCKLHQNLMELRQLARFESIYFEEPIRPENLAGYTNAKTLKLAAGLACHVESYAEAVRHCNAYGISISTWRKDFIGADIEKDARARARAKKAASGKGSARDELKHLTMERCRQLGFRPRSNDEADALGILDFALDFHEHVRPPWRVDEVLRPPMEART